MITGDYSGIADYMLINEEFARQLGTDRNLAAITSAATRSTAAAFARDMDIAAMAKPAEFHHMYDWGGLGNPSSRLWRYVLTGLGKTREMTYEFAASVKPVPRGIGLDGQPNPYDTRNAVHVFVWKAAMLELGATVTINPSGDKGVLVFPVAHNYNFAQGDPRSGMAFTNNPVTITLGKNTQGKFNEFWEGWWETHGQTIIIDDIKEPFETRVDSDLQKLYAKIVPSMPRPKGAALAINIGMKPKFPAKAKVTELIAGQLSGYVRASRQREVFAQGMGNMGSGGE